MKWFVVALLPVQYVHIIDRGTGGSRLHDRKSGEFEFFLCHSEKSHRISYAQFAARQCSISPQLSADRQNKLPVSRPILSTCKSVDLSVSRPGLIDS